MTFRNGGPGNPAAVFVTGCVSAQLNKMPGNSIINISSCIRMRCTL
jgi:hypothetical protein